MRNCFGIHAPRLRQWSPDRIFAMEMISLVIALLGWMFIRASIKYLSILRPFTLSSLSLARNIPFEIIDGNINSQLLQFPENAIYFLVVR